MDKLQSEYEALQQKLALLKRDTNRDGGRLQSTPRSVHAKKADAAAAAAPASVGGIMTDAAPESALAAGTAARSSSGDTGTLGSLAALHNCENLQLHCSIADTAGIMQSLQFLDKFPGSRLGQLASSSFNDPGFLNQCEQALSAQLQRTKDGATAQSRISELAGKHTCRQHPQLPVRAGCIAAPELSGVSVRNASLLTLRGNSNSFSVCYSRFTVVRLISHCAGLVKLLRRCMRDMAGKTSKFVEMCVKAEKEVHQEVMNQKATCF